MDIGKYVEADLQQAIKATIEKYPERYAALTDEARAEMHEKHRENCRGWIAKVIDRIDNGNPSDLRNAFHLGNPVSRQIFRDKTGVTLPGTESGTRQAIREWFGVEKWDSHFAELGRQEQERTEKRKAEEKQKELQGLLSERVRYHAGEGGVHTVGTMEEFIRCKLSQGFRLVVRKRGFSTGWVLRREDNGHGWQETTQFRGKILQEWIESIQPEYR